MGTKLLLESSPIPKDFGGKSVKQSIPSRRVRFPTQSDAVEGAIAAVACVASLVNLLTPSCDL